MKGTTYAARSAELRRLAKSGVTRADAAKAMGVSYWVVANMSRHLGVTFTHGLEKPTPRKTTPIGALVRAGVADELTAQQRLDVRILVRRGGYSAQEALEAVGRSDLMERLA